MLVIMADHDVSGLHFQTVQAVLIAEAVVSFPFVNEFFGIFQIDSLGLSFTLDIRTDSSVFIRAFIMAQSCFFQRVIDNLFRAFLFSYLIRILNSQDEITAGMAGDQIRIQRGP